MLDPSVPVKLSVNLRAGLEGLWLLDFVEDDLPDLLDVGYLNFLAVEDQNARVVGLAAAFRIERRLIEHDPAVYDLEHLSVELPHEGVFVVERSRVGQILHQLEVNDVLSGLFPLFFSLLCNDGVEVVGDLDLHPLPLGDLPDYLRG